MQHRSSQSPSFLEQAEIYASGEYVGSKLEIVKLTNKSRRMTAMTPLAYEAGGIAVTGITSMLKTGVGGARPKIVSKEAALVEIALHLSGKTRLNLSVSDVTWLIAGTKGHLSFAKAPRANKKLMVDAVAGLFPMTSTPL